MRDGLRHGIIPVLLIARVVDEGDTLWPDEIFLVERGLASVPKCLKISHAGCFRPVVRFKSLWTYAYISAKNADERAFATS